MKYRLTIETDNEAFGERNVSRGAEMARILRDLAKRLEQDGCMPGEERKLRDVNGNTVGLFESVEEGSAP